MDTHWVVIGIVALLSFVLGTLFSRNRMPGGQAIVVYTSPDHDLREGPSFLTLFVLIFVLFGLVYFVLFGG